MKAVELEQSLNATSVITKLQYFHLQILDTLKSDTVFNVLIKKFKISFKLIKMIHFKLKIELKP